MQKNGKTDTTKMPRLWIKFYKLKGDKKMNEKLTAEDKIIKAKVGLQKTNPFFAYLTAHLKNKETETIVSTIGVDNKGILYYNKTFIDTLDTSTMRGVLCHEVMHVALEHFNRGKIQNKNHFLFNIATDIVVNDMIEGDFTLPRGGLVPHNHEIDVGDVHIKEINKKTAEEIYYELFKKLKKQHPNCFKDTEEYGAFDTHIYGNDDGDSDEGKDGKGDGKNNKAKKGYSTQKKNWKEILSEASTYAKMQGKLPAGMERYIGEILQSKLDWKSMLYKYIVNEIPFDYTYSKPHKRSQSTGVYMPNILRESVDIIVAIDTSGSISDKELTEFKSEIVAISKSFANIRMTALFCDADVHDIIDITNGTIDKFIEEPVHGGGGTSFIPVFDWIQENKPMARILVYLTDGYGDFPPHETTRTLWVINNNDVNPPFGDKVTL